MVSDTCYAAETSNRNTLTRRHVGPCLRKPGSYDTAVNSSIDNQRLRACLLDSGFLYVRYIDRQRGASNNIRAARPSRCALTKRETWQSRPVIHCVGRCVTQQRQRCGSWSNSHRGRVKQHNQERANGSASEAVESRHLSARHIPYSRLPFPQKSSRLVAAVAGKSRHVAGKSRACGGLLRCFSRHSGTRRSFLRRKKRIVGGCLSIYVRRSGGDVHNAPCGCRTAEICRNSNIQCSTESMMWQP